LNEIAKSKMNDLSLMKAKGGHSWPPLLCEANVEYAMRPFLSNGLQIGDMAGFGAQNSQPALNLNRSTKLQVCTSPRLTQNRC
jgi:hypothetical protein